MKKDQTENSVASHGYADLLRQAAIEVVRASAIGDQNFIACLTTEDSRTVRLRLAICRMSEILRNDGKCECGQNWYTCVCSHDDDED
jgi:hypothetical protein